MHLQGKVALVTGAGHGIGKATAISLAREGADVAFTHLDQEAGAAETARLVEAQGRRAHVMHAELTDADTCRRIAREAIDVFGGVDVLVNNAGAGVRGELVSFDLERWHYALNLHLTAPFLTSQVIAAHMIERRRGGSIVNISSAHASHVWARAGAYGVAKAGLERLTRSMALEWAPHDIRANAIAPGYINVAETEAEQQTYEKWDGPAAPSIPVRRAGRPYEIAELVVFLASDAASYITGQAIAADGGLTLPPVSTADFMRGSRGAEEHVG